MMANWRHRYVTVHLCATAPHWSPRWMMYLR